MQGAAQWHFLALGLLLGGCVQQQPVAQWHQPEVSRPRTITVERPYVETPLPVKYREPPPLPALKPNGDPAPPEGAVPAIETTPSQRSLARMAALPVAPIANGASPPVTAPQLIGLSEADTTRLLGPAATTETSSLSRIWTYHSVACTLKLFFYQSAASQDFRTLTYQIEERGAGDLDHRACLASLARFPTT